MTAVHTTCHYVTLASGRQLHFRRRGEGPALMILHPSPQSSQAMSLALNAFSAHATCLAFDTPGYGLSDDLAEPATSLGDYAQVLMEAATVLGLTEFCVYGAATGAQIAIELGKRYSERIALVMLDANGHISKEERERILVGYTPDVTPRRDGGHLLTYWDMCCHLSLSFPWNSLDPAARLGVDQPSADVVHDTVLRYFQAGERYSVAYKIAFESESRAHLDGLTVPTTMMRWTGSPVLVLADQLIAEGLPANVRVLEAGDDIASRYALQCEALAQTIGERGLTSAPPFNQQAHDGTASYERQYLAVAKQALHVRVHGGSMDQPPVLLVHAAGQSSGQMLARAAGFVDGRTVIAIDLPGHGGSAALVRDGVPSVNDVARHIAAALVEARINTIDVIGEGVGGAIGCALQVMCNVRHLSVLDPLPMDEHERASFEACGVPDLTPAHDGTHLVRAWSMIRDGASFYPWFDLRAVAARAQPLSRLPADLHQRVVDVLRLGRSWSAWRAMELAVDWDALLAGGCVDQVLLSAEHPQPDRVHEVAQRGKIPVARS